MVRVFTNFSVLPVSRTLSKEMRPKERVFFKNAYTF